MQKNLRDRPVSPVSSPRGRSSVLAIRAAFGLAIVGVFVTGCTQQMPEPSVTPSETPSATAPAAPALLPEGTAAENLPYFDAVNAATLATNPAAGGQAIIDGLIAAGFPREEMEVSSDTTSIGDPADSIQFAIRWQGSCLLGQNGPATGYHSAVVSQLDTGRCLVGATRPIDW